MTSDASARYTNEEQAAIEALRARLRRASGIYHIEIDAVDGLGYPVPVLNTVAEAHRFLNERGEPR